MFKHRIQRRRGIVILVVLSLLVLFVLLAVTFAIVAGQYRLAAESHSREEQLGDPPRRVLDRAFYQVVRDTNLTTSPFRGHSFLRDLYGTSFRGTIINVSTPYQNIASGQFVRFTFQTPTTLSPLDGFYSGDVITFLSGAARNRSTRIVGYTINSSGSASSPTYQLLVLTPKSHHGDLIYPSNGDTFLINGKPFTGAGFAYNGSYDPTVAGSTRLTEQALRPNRVGETIPDFITNYTPHRANEAYDAPDFQNMALGAVMPQGIIPSFHRPALINYYRNQVTLSQNQSLLRQLVFRPIPPFHPNFTGSNNDPRYHYDSNLHPSMASYLESHLFPALCDIGSWDVDNDGDGVADSIWIDPGYPVKTGKDGRRYKVLIAPLCVDLDGRINLNAHGNYSQLAPGIQPLPIPVRVARDVQTMTWPKGSAYGPPEINPNALINNATEFGDLMASRYRASGSQMPGAAGFDLLSQAKFFEYPLNFFSAASSAFSSPADLRGEFAVGIDELGQPIFESSPQANLLADNAYEFNLIRHDGNDNPFTVADLESILRKNDRDILSLSSRLASLVTVLHNDAGARRSVTTHSFDLPVPGVVELPDFLGTGYTSIIEMLAHELNNSGVSPNVEIPKLLSPELLSGLRMDINRPFGNGRDDNGNLIVDEHPGVLLPPSSQQAVNESFTPSGTGTQPEQVFGFSPVQALMTFDHDNDGVVFDDTDAFLARQRMAKDLYVLMMLLKDRNYVVDFDGNPTNNARETARMIAQWAINVVDFRDADSIMTPFEYDINPFDGWSVDGLLSTTNEPQRDVVWGTERPELLITGTLAFHDRRTEDRDDEDGTNAAKTTDNNPDGDFDQRLRPRGALFVELYNPWTGHQKHPAEFYRTASNPTSVTNQLELNKVSQIGGSPVWRLIVTSAAIRDPDDPDNPIAASDIERGIYFTSGVNLGGGPGGRRQHFTHLPPQQVAPLLPGRYAVIGGTHVNDQNTGTYREPIGRRIDAQEGGSLGIAKTRQILLTPNPNPNVHQVNVLNNQSPPATQNDAATTDDPTLPSNNSPASIQPAISIPITLVHDGDPNNVQTRPLSVSEPLNGYRNSVGGSVWDPMAADGEGAYVPPIDQPLDTGNALLDAPRRYVHLQRLANPLLPFDANTNPYRTIDSMPVELTVFNGVESSGTDPSVNDDPDQPLASLQRGDSDSNTSPPFRRLLWLQENGSVAGPALPEANPVHVFGQQLRHTLGFLNRKYSPRFTSANAPTPPATIGGASFYVGAPNCTVNTTQGIDYGPPFPWLVWNNRPFVNQYELLLVPRTRSSELLAQFRPANTSASYSPYDTPIAEFNHLLNFFHSSPTPGAAPNFHRLFEFTEVPSRFVDTNLVLNANVFSNPSIAATNLRRPPFNVVSQYRVPGKINLNTIYDGRVWNALWNGHQRPGFNQFVVSRRGYFDSGNTSSPLGLNPNSPTFFANPFRPSGTGDLVPPVGSSNDGLKRISVDATLLRSSRIAPDLNPPTPSEAPTFENNFLSVADAGRQSNRNAYFRYQSLGRLANLTTTRSNVYAIWLTMGYFEVEPNLDNNGNVVYDPYHPDGLRLGRELGIDTGDVKRHRAFYILDRSIPVAFEPGENHNVDEAVLLRRFIE